MVRSEGIPSEGNLVAEQKVTGKRWVRLRAQSSKDTVQLS